MYAYGYFAPHSSVLLTVGASHDSYETGNVSQRLWNPKLGVTWAATNSLTLRTAAFKSLKRPLIADQTIEPTQVVGFNRLFDEANGMRSENLAAGVDFRWGQQLFASLEGMHRDLRLDSGLIGLPIGFAPEQKQLEQLGTGTISWIASRRVILSFGLQYD